MGLLFITLDINECDAAQCDAASTECKNTPGAFSCMCKPGFRPNLDCRPRGDLGVSDGGIPDDAMFVSSTAAGYEKNVRFLRMQSVKFMYCTILYSLEKYMHIIDKPQLLNCHYTIIVL